MTDINSNVAVTETPGTQWGLYTKAISALVVTGLTAYITAASDGVVDTVDWISIVIAIIAAAGIIWAIPSTPQWVAGYGKAIAAALIAGLSSIIIGLTQGNDGLTQVEIITAIVGTLTALGLVGAAPNAASSDQVSPETRKIVPVTREEKVAMIEAPAPTPNADFGEASPRRPKLPPNDPTDPFNSGGPTPAI